MNTAGDASSEIRTYSVSSKSETKQTDCLDTNTVYEESMTEPVVECSEVNMQEDQDHHEYLDVPHEPIEDTSYYNEMRKENYYVKEFTSYEDFLGEKAAVEEQSRVKFVYLSKPRDFMLKPYEHLVKLGAKNLSERRLMWELNAGTIFSLDYSGYPFYQLSDPIKFGCEFGRQLKPSMVTVVTEQGFEEDDGSGRVAKKRKTESKVPRKIKKVGCSAMICVRKILRFSGITPAKRNKRYKNIAGSILKDIIGEWAAAGDPISELLERSGGEVVYVGYFPVEEAHDRKHAIGVENNSRESVHPSIREYIRKLACHMGRFTNEFCADVHHFVKNNFPEAMLEENLTRRKYWPSYRTIQTIVYMTLQKRQQDSQFKEPCVVDSVRTLQDKHNRVSYLDPTVVSIISETSEDELMNTRNYVGRVLDIEAAKERLRTVVKNIESLSDVRIMENAAETLENMYSCREKYMKDEEAVVEKKPKTLEDLQPGTKIHILPPPRKNNETLNNYSHREEGEYTHKFTIEENSRKFRGMQSEKELQMNQLLRILAPVKDEVSSEDFPALPQFSF
ncbi:hypothetical protein QYM36_001119 [Artemia franciscana]|uniref:Uncharacterized protein n=1 Tax=Artemia franciscana TaxID=6661 RepID=A0AA88I9R8_ARTSF|nr:hypothetical protein QYM36_001119 [Artemia franciscana]